VGKFSQQPKRPSITDVRSHGGEGVVQCGHFAVKVGEGTLQMQMSSIFGVKNSEFFEIYDVFVQTRRERG